MQHFKILNGIAYLKPSTIYINLLQQAMMDIYRVRKELGTLASV